MTDGATEQCTIEDPHGVDPDTASAEKPQAKARPGEYVPNQDAVRQMMPLHILLDAAYAVYNGAETPEAKACARLIAQEREQDSPEALAETALDDAADRLLVQQSTERQHHEAMAAAILLAEEKEQVSTGSYSGVRACASTLAISEKEALDTFRSRRTKNLNQALKELDKVDPDGVISDLANYQAHLDKSCYIMDGKPANRNAIHCGGDGVRQRFAGKGM